MKTYTVRIAFRLGQTRTTRIAAPSEARAHQLAKEGLSYEDRLRCVGHWVVKS